MVSPVSYLHSRNRDADAENGREAEAGTLWGSSTDMHTSPRVAHSASGKLPTAHGVGSALSDDCGRGWGRVGGRLMHTHSIFTWLYSRK